MCKLHFSLDDVKGVFKALIEENPDSIFETRTLGFLEKMHELYNIDIDLYCTYQDRWYCLEDVPDRYRDEFQNNNWLHFGYHCHDENLHIADYAYSFGEKYRCFENALFNVTGQEKCGPVLRLHGFEGPQEVCMFLKKAGIDYLLGADVYRNCYYLNEDIMKLLQNNLSYFDRNTGLNFVRSCTILENVKEMKFSELEKEIGLYLDMQCSIIPIFTHEWQLDRVEVRKLFERCCIMSIEVNR